MMRLACLTDSEIWLSFKKEEKWAISYIYKGYSPKLYQYEVKFTHKNWEKILKANK